MNNLWLSRMVSFAYQYQQEARPYQNLIADFADALDLRGLQCVVDLGCGSGRIIRLLWERSSSTLNRLVGIDRSLAAINYARRNLDDRYDDNHRCILVHADMIDGLSLLESDSVGLITAGLSIQYAEHWDGSRWTQHGYRRVVADVFRCLNPGGQFVFSVNVPNPDFSRIARDSWREILFSWRMPLLLVVAGIMVWQGKWLARQARIGRFHYLPIEEVTSILQQAGFSDIRYKLSYAGLAWVISCRKPLEP